MSTPVCRVVHIKLLAYSAAVQPFADRVALAASLAGLRAAGPVPLPTKTKRFTVLRSPFKHKRAQEAFAIHDHRRLVSVEGTVDETDKLVKFVLADSPPEIGVALRVEDHFQQDQVFSLETNRLPLR